MPRRVYTYPTGRGWDVWNFVATLGSFCIALSVLVFMYNLWVSRKGPQVSDDPWDARTLEWTIPSPPPEYNFKEIPIVTARDDFWHQKYTEDENGRAVLREKELPVGAKSPQEEATEEVESSTDVALTDDAGVARATGTATATTATGPGDDHGDGEHGDGEHEEHVHIHMPSPSYWPAFTALGLAVISYGMIYKFWVVAVLGGVWLLGGIYSWGLEPATEPDPPAEPNRDHATLAPEDEPSGDLEPAGHA